MVSGLIAGALEVDWGWIGFILVHWSQSGGKLGVTWQRVWRWFGGGLMVDRRRNGGGGGDLMVLDDK